MSGNNSTAKNYQPHNADSLTMLSAEDLQQKPELIDMLLQQLKTEQYDQHHPTRFFYIQALLRKAEGKNQALQLALKTKAIAAIGELKSLAAPSKANSPAASSSALAELSRALHEKNLQTAAPHNNSLEANLRQQEDKLMASPASNSPRTAMEIYQQTAAELNTENFIKQVINETPQGEPGPLNAHMLVIKTLSAMQQISPSYLRRIVTQIDTMFYLSEAGITTAKKPIKSRS
ncbi:DUF2894 domain-containing protein [Dasania sp. GY-MA-18]|uniref:DUF2894 domain-containing protein n=1 Tax=Dasania phycosphaerae TaxID=2950436 RepID=A0A9J6RHZ2_9GAMM|nr:MULTISPECIES: DUF2894 domain-containing protein [Dasania]MCR8921624.1 DUF2894 domain-containing protein [Dasania sp. GY-MA-18]MCZ0864052.1 DUF2894 domain-containing protein [Dasania phycosphaerae]MCZ0867780.1 DUF2894 domain-containing protein [Dasania phycosphaerae]